MSTASLGVTPNRNKEGMILLASGLFLFSFQDMTIKSFSNQYSVLQIVFVRSLIATILLCSFAFITHGKQVIIARQSALLLFKGFIYFFAFTFYYMAFPMLPVADVVAVTFLAPIIVTLLSIGLLKEKVGIKRWCAVVAGFIGVLLVVGPDGKIFNIGTLFAFGCALTYGGGSVLTRYVTRGDPPITIAIYSMFVITVMSGLCYLIVLGLDLKTGINPSIDFLLREWVWVYGIDRWLLLFIGCIASVGFYLHGRAYLVAQASKVAPFEYCYVFYTVFLAYLFFDEVPGPLTLLGIAILIGSSLYIWHRAQDA